jgi:hypothetical protein
MLSFRDFDTAFVSTLTFVKQHDLRVLHEHSCQGDSLLLTCFIMEGQGMSHFADAND